MYRIVIENQVEGGHVYSTHRSLDAATKARAAWRRRADKAAPANLLRSHIEQKVGDEWRTVEAV